MSKIQSLLEEKVKSFIEGKKQLRENKTKDVSKYRLILPPSIFRVSNYPRRPAAVFNPGAVLKGGKVYIFPRLVFDYYKYVSSIGVFELDVEDILSGKLPREIEVQILLWPKNLWEFLGCEDPRVIFHGDEFLMLYTGKGGTDREEKKQDVLGFVRLDGAFNVKERGFFRISDGTEEFLPKSTKDSAFLEIEGSKASILTRIHIGEEERLLCWKGWADLEKKILDTDSLEPVLGPEEWEIKVGWSTNALKLSDTQYLVGWHAVLKEDLSYRNGFAVVDGKGNLLGTSDYTLFPKGIKEEYGDRPLVIFGDGLIRVDNKIVWIGGVGDYAIGIFIADFNDVLENIRNV